MKLVFIISSLLLLTTCAAKRDSASSSDVKTFDHDKDFMDQNLAAGTSVFYEVQLRSANACDPTVGANWQKQACAAKPAPKVTYRAEGMQCNILNNLHRIKLGTIEDMLENTDDYRKAISLRYIKDRVGANVMWVMPPFPNNDTWSIPDSCDNLGSPYAVRDYLHIQGSLSQDCIAKGRDEHSSEPCWGNDSFDKLIQEAHKKGLKVMLDVAFNHFGHNYIKYDYADYKSVPQMVEEGQDLGKLWDFDATFDNAHMHPNILDNPSGLGTLKGSYANNSFNALKAHCPSIHGHQLLQAYGAWRDALDHEKKAFNCSKNYIDYLLPGFYMGRDRSNPAKQLGDNFTNNWRDVKFLFHNESNALHQHEFIRNREYLFRIMNYWVSRGVDGFRLDHTTDPDSRMAPNEWRYIISKTNYYAQKRGQQKPIYMAEEFGDQMGMTKVVDVMTEGYVFDMNARGGGEKNASHVERVFNNMNRFEGKTYCMTALETHDEHRLVDHTGFNQWTGAGFWGAGATTWSTPMLLMGQEFGEKWGVGFRRSDYIRARYVGTENYFDKGDDLVNFYGNMIKNRLSHENRALYSSNKHYLRTKEFPNGVDQRIFAQMKWSEDFNVVFAFHNLWEEDVAQKYFIPQEVANAAGIRDDYKYKLYDLISKEQKGPCKMGSELKWELFVEMNKATRAQWLRLETCQ